MMCTREVLGSKYNTGFCAERFSSLETMIEGLHWLAPYLSRDVAIATAPVPCKNKQTKNEGNPGPERDEFRVKGLGFRV